MLKKFYRYFNNKQKANIGSKQQNDIHDIKPLGYILSENVNIIRQSLPITDLNLRDIYIKSLKLDATIIYISGLVDSKQVYDNLLKPLLSEITIEKAPEDTIYDILIKNVITIGNIQTEALLDGVLDGVLKGKTVLLVEGLNKALLIETKGWQQRAVEEPQTESVVRGPREGFVETMQTNLSLLRRKIKSKDLTIETVRLGEISKTDVSIVYLKGVAKPELIEEIKRRLYRIKIDAILDSCYIEELIEDNPFSLFPTIASTEKPDKVAANLLEGRAAIFVDGTPFVLTMPSLFIEAFQSPDDYYIRPISSTFTRMVRYLAFFIALLSPSIYVAAVNFHQELISTDLIVSIAAAREGVPFPVTVETLIMLTTFFILREASARMPRTFGQAINIVGALIIGQAAVQAGFISAPMVIIIAITAVSIFIVPSFAQESLIMSFIFTLAASFFGLLGIITIFLFLLVHSASLRSFGVPFLSPIMPFNAADFKDVTLRPPLWARLTRPKDLEQEDLLRQSFNLMPEPPSEK